MESGKSYSCKPDNGRCVKMVERIVGKRIPHNTHYQLQQCSRAAGYGPSETMCKQHAQLHREARPLKYLVLGHGEHGKDEFAKSLTEIAGVVCTSSSMAACELAVFPTLSKKYGYKTVEECFNDRRNHRIEWRDLISEFNTPDKASLAKAILEKNDCYIGMRCDFEYQASKKLFDHVFWIDRSQHKPLDPSMGIHYNPEEMILINNNGTVDSLRTRAKTVIVELLSRRRLT